jgi:peptidyl-prolyl cis-trans isomerase A (cyclophilin A)
MRPVALTACRLATLAACLLAAPIAAAAAPSARPGPPHPAVPPGAPVVIIDTSLGAIEVALDPAAAPATVANFLGLADGTKPFKDPKAGGQEVKRRFYDGLTFHRVLKDFMIQAGCPKGDGTGGPGYGFANEISAAALGLDKALVLDAEGRADSRLMIGGQADFERLVLQPLIKSMGVTTREQFLAKSQEIDQRVRTLTVKDVYALQGYAFDDRFKSFPLTRGVLAMANAGPATNGSQWFIAVVDTPWLDGKHTPFGRVVKGMEVVDAIAKVAADANGRPAKPVVIKSIRRRKGPKGKGR